MTARWYSPATASEHCGFSADTIGDALRSGELRGYQRKPGGRWRISAEDLDAWMRGEDPPPVHVPVITRGRIVGGEAQQQGVLDRTPRRPNRDDRS